MCYFLMKTRKSINIICLKIEQFFPSQREAVKRYIGKLETISEKRLNEAFADIQIGSHQHTLLFRADKSLYCSSVPLELNKESKLIVLSGRSNRALLCSEGPFPIPCQTAEKTPCILR